jgi:hypothetical protein
MPQQGAFRLQPRPDPVAYYIAEATMAHRRMDEAGVPRIADGQALSLSQRVDELVQMHRLALTRR